MAFLPTKNKFFSQALILTALFFGLTMVGQTYTITGTVNASTLSCSTLSASGIKTINIGDGTNAASLIIDQNLDLSCLGSILINVKNNSNITTGGKDITLADGSLFVFSGSGTLSSSNCSASNKIQIGSQVLATCNGGGNATYSFAQLVSQRCSSPGIPTLSLVTQPNCSVAKGSFTITNYNSALTYTVTPSTGVTISGSTINAPAGSYTVTAGIGSCTSAASNSTSIDAQPLKPVITTQPVSQTTCSGTAVTFSVAATGSGIGYQWQRNGNNLGGATSSTYTTSIAGNYTVVITGTCTPYATSNTATLTVNSIPVISSVVSNSANICLNSIISLTATATGGTAPYTYTWSTTSTAAGLNTNTSANTTTATPTTSGSKYYRVVATDANGCSSVIASSPSATVNVSNSTLATPTITSGSSTTICSGSSVILTSSASSGNQWYKDNVLISGATGTTYSATASGTYTVITTGTCSSSASAGTTVTVTAPSMPLAGTPTQPTCAVNTGSVALSNLPGGNWTLKSGSTTVATGSGNTYTATGLASGTYNFTVANASGCTSQASNAVVINSAPAVPSVPTIGTITQPTSTTPNGSFTISNYNSAYTYTVNPSTGVTISGNTVTAPAGTYAVTATLGSCTSAASDNVVITLNKNKTWNGLQSTDWFIAENWTPAGVPTSSTDVVIANASNAILISKAGAVAYANSITVLNGGKLEVNPGNTLNVIDFVNVNAGGTLNLQSSASLIQTNNTANTGIINVYRDSAPLLFNDYTYWSSPTSGTQTLSDFSPKSNPKYFLTYDNNWIYADASGTTFTSGIGYAIIAPKSVISSPVYTGTFKGVPNNGDIMVKASGSTYKLVGNPYPSALDADAFIQANISGGTGTKTISGALYFWSRSGSNSSKDYVVYSLGGTVPHSSTTPGPWIASGEGFVVETVPTGSGNIIFTNNMRTSGAGYTNSNFSKNANITTGTTSLEKNRIWLNLTNGSSNTSQTLIGYIQTATNAVDPGFDATYFSSNKTGIYSLLGSNNYTIQAKALPFTNSDIVPLGYVTDIKGNSTISIDSVDGLFADSQDIFIEDKLLNIVHNLKVSPYTFATEAGTFNDRFVMKYTSNQLGLNDLAAESNDVIISSKNHEIKIQSETESIDKVFVYNILGKEIQQNTKVNTNQTLISDLNDNQILIVKVVLANGRSISKKVAL